MTGGADASPAGGPPPPAPRRRVLGRLRLALAAGFFPTVVGAHAGGLAWARAGIPSHGILLALAAFAGGFGLTLALLLVLWRRPAGRVIVKVAVLAHVLFWGGKGWLSTSVREAGEIETRPATVWQGPPQAFLAGYGEAAFPVRETDTLAGYGMPPRRVALPWPAPGPLFRASLALMEPRGEGGAPRVPMFRAGTRGTGFLGAKAVVLRPAAGKAAPLAICRLDLVMCDARIRDAVLSRVADLGFVEDTLLLSATHTHSGPGGFSRTCLACAMAVDHFRPEVFERVVAAAAASIRAAHGSAIPARIGFVRARDQGQDGRPVLAQNRAQETDRDRVDREVLGVRLDAADGERRIALVLNYAVHPTWARPRDFEFSPDVAGALEASAEIGSGAPVLFVNGAEGDVSPHPGLRGKARDEKAVLEAFEKAVGADLAPRGTADKVRIAASTVRRDLGSGRFLLPFAGERGTLLPAAERPFRSGLLDGAGNALCLPLNVLLWSAAVPEARLAASPRGAVGLFVSLEPDIETRRWPFGAVRLETEVGAVAIVSVPGELTTAVGERAKESARLRGAARAFVFGLSADHFAYCATPEECAQGTYEGKATLFGPEESARVLESIDAALLAVGFAPPAPPK